LFVLAAGAFLSRAIKMLCSVVDLRPLVAALNGWIISGARVIGLRARRLAWIPWPGGD